MEPWLLQASTHWAGDDFLNINWSIHQVGFCNLGTYYVPKARDGFEMDDLVLPWSLQFKYLKQLDT